MNIIFFGTSDFAVPALEGLFRSRHKVLAVVTAADEKRGRGQKVGFSPVKVFAQKNGLPIFQPADLRDRNFLRALKEQAADLFAVAAYGRILTKEVLRIPRLYAVNLHGSLLPQYRGAAPVNWAVIHGEKTSGITVFKMNEFMDKGEIILQEETDILQEDTSFSLGRRMAEMGRDALVKSVDLIEQGRAVFAGQDETKVSFAPKLRKEDGRIDWNAAAVDIHNRVRGLQPWPGAFTCWEGKLLKIWNSAVVNSGEEGNPGQIVDIEPRRGILVQTGRDKLLITELQLAGKKRMAAAEFMLGHRITRGMKI